MNHRGGGLGYGMWAQTRRLGTRPRAQTLSELARWVHRGYLRECVLGEWDGGVLGPCFRVLWACVRARIAIGWLVGGGVRIHAPRSDTGAQQRAHGRSSSQIPMCLDALTLPPVLLYIHSTS